MKKSSGKKLSAKLTGSKKKAAKRPIAKSSRPALSSELKKSKAQLIEELSRLRRDNTRLKNKLKKQQCQEHSLFLEQLINTIPSPIFYKDEKARYMGCNKAFEKFIGTSLSNIKGKSVYDLSPKDLADKYHEMDKALFDNPGTQTYESTVQTADMGRRNVIFNKATFTKTDGTLGGLIGIITDITERNKAEQQVKESLEEKEILLKEINHRVKNNLAILRSLVRMQTAGITDSTAKGYLENVENRIRVLSLIHERLYNTSKVTQIDINDYIRNLATEIYGSLVIDKTSTRLQLDISKAFLNINYVIPAGLIINELLTNALKYAFPMNEKGTVSISFKKEPGNKYRLSVKDTGIGMPKGYDMSESGGLGMKIVQSLVRQIHGEFELKRSNGTEAIITFKDRSAQSD